MENSNYTSLMARRVKRILLVCNNYDSFALEEDGRIDVQIAQEYAELNLSNPPSITRAETTKRKVESRRRTVFKIYQRDGRKKFRQKIFHKQRASRNFQR